MKKNINDEYKNLQIDYFNNNQLQQKLVSNSNNNYNNNSIENKKPTNSKKIISKRSIMSNNMNKNLNLHLSRNVRWFIFCILVFVTIMINMDHGTIPAATEEIIKSLDLKNDDLGVFGSLVFLGNIIGIYFIFN